MKHPISQRFLLTLLAGLVLQSLVSTSWAEYSIWNPMRFIFPEKPETEQTQEAPKTPVKPVSAKAPKTVNDSEEPKNFTMTEIDKSARDTEENAPILKEYQGFLIQTEKGNIGIEVFPEQAPATVKNFLKLVEEKFYDKPSMVFHRVVPGFVIQTGDPTGTGMGGSGKRVPLEVKNKLSHNAKGMVAMARTSDPNSATSQFYITLAPQTSLDGKYAVFGKVISGSDVLDKIKQGDKLYGIKLIDKRALVPDKKEDKKGLGHFKNLFGTPSKS